MAERLNKGIKIFEYINFLNILYIFLYIYIFILLKKTSNINYISAPYPRQKYKYFHKKCVKIHLHKIKPQIANKMKVKISN
jgi:hypothetical protein